MQHTQTILIAVNGKTIKAHVSIDAPGLETEDCLSAQMILSAAANQQDVTYHSRHHKDRAAILTVRNGDIERPTLRLVA